MENVDSVAQINDAVSSRLRQFSEKVYKVYVSPQNAEGLELTIENLRLENVDIYIGEGYAATSLKKDVEQKNSMSQKPSSSLIESGNTDNNANEEQQMTISETLDINSMVQENGVDFSDNGNSTENVEENIRMDEQPS